MKHPELGRNMKMKSILVFFKGTNTQKLPFPRSKSNIKAEYRDGVTGATITFNAIRDGGLRAIELLKNEL